MRNPKLLAAIGIVIVAIFVIAGINNIVTTNNKLKLREVQLKSVQAEIKELNSKYDKVNSDLDKAVKDGKASKEEVEKINQEKQELERQKQELEAQLQAKLDAKNKMAKAQTKVANAVTNTQVAYAASGNCASWIAGAGIADVANAQELIRRESGCNPNAVNPSSGACGVAQELPCGKSGCSLGDGACQVAWMNRYVLGRYGSWGNAVAFHNANNWY